MYTAVMQHAGQPRMQPQPHLMAHPSMAANGSPPAAFRTAAAPHGSGRAAMPPAGTPGGGMSAGHLHQPGRGPYAKRPSDDTTSTTAGAPSSNGGAVGGSGKGGKKGKPSRQRALEHACPAVLRHKINESDLQGLVIECDLQVWRCCAARAASYSARILAQRTATPSTPRPVRAHACRGTSSAHSAAVDTRGHNRLRLHVHRAGKPPYPVDAAGVPCMRGPGDTSSAYHPPCFSGRKA